MHDSVNDNSEYTLEKAAFEYGGAVERARILDIISKWDKDFIPRVSLIKELLA